MRAVKIDPISRTVTEINLKKNPNNTLQELYEIIGGDLVELVQIDRGIIMVVDEEGKCKAVQGAFTFIGWGTIIAGTAIILGGSGDRFKALPENLASFQMMTEWIEPADVPPPRQKIISIQSAEQNMKTVLIEKTAKRLKFYELIITALLFITLLSGFGALYIAIPLAIGVWSITGLCLIAFIGIRIIIWWHHG